MVSFYYKTNICSILLIKLYFKSTAEKFFETLKKEELNVVFKKQLKDDDIITMIKGISRK